MPKRTCKLKWWSWKLNLVVQARKILHAHTVVGKNRYGKGKQRVFIKYSQKIRIQITNRQEGHMQNGGFEPDKTSSKWNKQVEEKRVTKSSYDWFRIAHYSDKKKIKYKNCEPEIFYFALLHCSWNLPGAEMALVCEMEEWTGPSGEKAWLFFYRKSLIRSSK